MKKTIFALLLVLTIILAGCKTAEPVVDAVNDESAAKIAEMEAALAEAEAKAEEAASASADELAAAQAELEAAQAELDAAKAEMEAAAVEVEEPAAEPVEISWLIFETPALTASFWDEVIANGIKDSGVPGLTVEKFVTPGADRTAYAKQLISAGTVPDLMQSIATQDFVDSGLLQPWDQAWCEEHFIMPMATSIDGKIWQAPTNSQVIPFVFYNKDLFAQVGVEVPTTWAEFQDVVLKLRAAGIKPIQIVGGSDGGWAAAFTLEGIISAEVLGSTPDWAQQRKAGTVKFTDAAMETAFNKYKWLVDNDAFDIADLGVGFGDANSAFGEGKAAMYFMGSWFLQYDAIKDAAFEPGVFLFPREDGKQVVPFSVGGGIHISAESAHPDETNAFARAVALSPSFMKSIIESDGAISMVKGMTVEAYGATVTDVYKEAMNFVGVEGLMNVAAFDWVANDFALAPGMQGEINISAQAIMNGADVMSELQRLDAAWDLASE